MHRHRTWLLVAASCLVVGRTFDMPPVSRSLAGPTIHGPLRRKAALSKVAHATGDEKLVDPSDPAPPAWLVPLRRVSELHCLAGCLALTTCVVAALVATRGQPGPPCLLLREVLAGGLAAGLTEIAFYPTEHVKVRMQTVTAPEEAKLGLVATARVIYREMGWSGLWCAGVVAGFLRALVYQGLRLGLFPAVKRLLLERVPGAGPLLQRVAAGMLTGMLGAALCSPFDLVKVQLSAPATRGRFANSLDALATVALAEGPRALWRAGGATVLRAAVASGAQLATYDLTKAAIAAGGANSDPRLVRAAP
jgi:hypothetical protein